jgi:hypothetical protein
VAENIIIIPSGGTIQFIDSADTITELYVEGSQLRFSGNLGDFLSLDANSTINANYLDVDEVRNNTTTLITWNQEEFDTDAYHSTSSNTSRITIPAGKAGKYLISGFILFHLASLNFNDFFFLINPCLIMFFL